MLMDEFISKLEENCKVKVEKESVYDVERGWAPLIVRLSSQQMNRFSTRYPNTGMFYGVKFQVQSNGTIIFYGKKGSDIYNMLI